MQKEISLTHRELQILDLIADGLSNKEIADKLYLSKHTIKAHLEHLFQKFDIHNRVQLAVKWVQFRINA